MGVEGCRHIVNAYDTAIEEQSPIVGIWHSGGARLVKHPQISTALLQLSHTNDRPKSLGFREMRRRQFLSHTLGLVN